MQPPVIQACKIDSGGSGEMLKSGFGKSNKARKAEFKGTCSLRDGALDASPRTIGFMKMFSALEVSGLLKRVMQELSWL